MLVNKIKKAIIVYTNRRRTVGNTKQNGEVNFVIYRDPGDSHYTAVCLDFDIVEEGTNLKQLKKSIEEAARLHLESVVENNLDDKLLNRSAPQKYWKILYEGLTAYEKLAKQKSKPQIRKQSSVSDVWNRSSKELTLA